MNKAKNAVATTRKGKFDLKMLKPMIDPLALAQAKKRFEWLITFLICNFKFVHQVLGIMNKVAIPTGTMGVAIQNGKLTLVYNPAFVEMLIDEEGVYVFYHEVLHVVLHHCTSRRTAEPLLWNVATDLAVNELIPEIPDTCLMPRDEKGVPAGCFVSEFKKNPMYKDMQEKQTAEWYFEYLKTKGWGKGKSKKGKGQSGQGEDDGDDQQGGGEGQQIDDHSGWKEDEIAAEKVRAKVRDIEQQDLWGTLSATDREMILSAQIRRINWRNKIRQFFGNLVWKDKMYTRKRPNRRYGFMHPGSKRILIDRYLVAVDTSGSIDSGLLSQFLAVINGLTDYMPIDVMQFDWDRTSDPKPFDRRKDKFEFLGRGGTSFEPVMQAVKKYHYKGVIILTDGCSAAVTKPPSYVKVLWVMPVGCKPPVDWGERVYMSKYV